MRQVETGLKVCQFFNGKSFKVLLCNAWTCLQVFFRAGVLGMMEEIREDRIAEILSWLQATARGKMGRITYKKLQEQKASLKRKTRGFAKH